MAIPQKPIRPSLRKQMPLKGGNLSLKGIGPEQIKQLVQELETYQTELEMQNDELRRAQEEIERSRALYFDLYDMAPLGYFTLNSQKLILSVNLTGASTLGSDKSSLLNQPFTNFIFPEDQDGFYLLMADLFRTESPQSREIRIVQRNGAMFYARIDAVTRHDGKEREARIIVTDITAQKDAELRLEARAKQLRALAGELTMTEQRERKRLSKVLHDGLQQYLVAAKLRMSEIIAESDGPLKQTSSEIDHLLSESIMVSRSLAAELSPPILHDSGLLAGLEWLCRWMSKKHGLKVQLVMEMKDPPSLSEDVKALLFESVRELLLNVGKHADTKAAKVELSGPQNSKLRISVSDDGKGFEYSAMSSGYETGEGLGLFSILERTSLVGGNLEINSSPGKGARLTITIPYGIPEPLGTEGTPSADKTEGVVYGTSSSPGGKVRVLITDDHAVMREGLVHLLKLEPDFEVIGQASDGREAVDKAEELNPDVVLMDISMPNLNGIDATRIIRKHHPGIQIIGLSLYSEEERAKEMLEAGAVLYVTKSGPASELKAAIRACLNLNRTKGHADA